MPVLPQHETAPVVEIAHVFAEPALMAATPLAGPERTGTLAWPRRGTLVPISPYWFLPQHMAVPVAVSAHACVSPMEIALTLLDRPTTSTGVALSTAVPLPSWPPSLAPQHLTPPPAVTTQVLMPPAAIATTGPPRPTTSTGVRLPAVVPLPSWPERLRPQQLTPPAIVSAQVCQELALIATIVFPALVKSTSTGTRLLVVVPLPSWPASLAPQHFTPPDRSGRRCERGPRRSR